MRRPTFTSVSFSRPYIYVRSAAHQQPARHRVFPVRDFAAFLDRTPPRNVFSLPGSITGSSGFRFDPLPLRPGFQCLAEEHDDGPTQRRLWHTGMLPSSPRARCAPACRYACVAAPHQDLNLQTFSIAARVLRYFCRGFAAGSPVAWSAGSGCYLHADDGPWLPVLPPHFLVLVSGLPTNQRPVLLE